MHVTAVLTPAPEGGYTAFNPETGTFSEGDSLDSAVDNLKEAVGLYLEVFPLAPTGATFTIPENA